MGCFDSSSSKQTSTGKTAGQTSLINRATDLYGDTLGVNKVFTGDRVAGFAPLQAQAITGAGNFVNSFSQPQTVGTPLGPETGMATRSLLTGTAGATPLSDADVENFYQAKYFDPAQKNLRETTNPLIDEAFAGPGFFGSARSNARAKAATDLGDSLSAQRADLLFENQRRNQDIAEAKAGRQLGALSEGRAFGDTQARNTMQNLEIASSQVQGLKELFGFGAKEQTQEQAELQAELTQWLDENEVTDPENIAIILSLLNQSFSASVGSSSGPGLGFSMATAAAGGAAQGFFTPKA